MHECELCALLKIQCIISQIITKIKPLIQPFECITFDLIQHDSIYNENQWTVYIICDFIDFNIIFII